MKKKKKHHNKIVLLGIDKLSTIEVLISKSLVHSYISHDEFVSINNVLREYNSRKEEMKKSWNVCVLHYIKTMETYCGSFERNTENENLSVRKTKQNRLLFSLQFKKSTISIIIQMISLKWIKELIDFYLAETRILCLIHIQNRIYL